MLIRSGLVLSSHAAKFLRGFFKRQLSKNGR